MSDVQLIIEIPDDVYTRLFDNGIQDNEITVDDICEMARALRIGTPIPNNAISVIPISVIEGMREEIQHIDDFEVVNGKLYIREFDAVGIIDRHIKEYKAESEGV